MRGIAINLLRLTLLIVFSIILLSQTPQHWQQDSIWDNEKLLVFDHLHLLHRGVALWHINLARIPSIAPDYLIAEITRWLSQDIRLQYLLFIIGLSALQLGLSAAIVSSLAKARLEITLVNFTLISYLLGWLSPDFASNRSLAALPLNHGGNLAMVLLFDFILISFIAKQNKLTQPKAAILGLVALAAVASNHIFLVQALGPAIALLAWPRQPWLLPKQSRLVLVALITGAAGGLLLSKVVLKTGCTPPLNWDGPQILTHLNNLFQTGSSGVGIGFLLLCNLGFSLLILCRQASERPARFYAALVLSGSTLCFLLYQFIFRNQGLGADKLRYLLPQISATSIVAAYWLTISLRSPRRKPITILLAFFLGSLIASQSAKITNVGRIFTEWANPYSGFIAQNVPPGIGILTAEEKNNLASSRSLKAGSNWRIIASQIASDGNPNPWDQGKAEFYSDAKSKTLRKYRAVFLPKDEHKKALNWYGTPSRIARDLELDVELFLFDDQHAAQLDQKLSQALAGDFRVSCN